MFGEISDIKSHLNSYITFEFLLWLEINWFIYFSLVIAVILLPFILYI